MISLLIYNKHMIDIYEILNLFNSLSPNLKFSLEVQTNSRLNYLELTLFNNHNGISHDVYRKPTTTDTIIPMDSYHLFEEKIAAIRYFADRINTYELSKDKKRTEIKTVKYMLRSNSYDASLLDKMIKEQGSKKHIRQQSPEHPKPKWEKFTYVGNLTRTITMLFLHSQVKIAFTTNNKLTKILRNNTTEKDNK